MVQNGGAAFPKEHTHMHHHQRQDGMSLRDYFACHILQGMVQPNVAMTMADVEKAYKVACMMIEARNKDYTI